MYKNKKKEAAQPQNNMKPEGGIRMVRDRIVYIPFAARGSRTNEYIINMIRILKKSYLAEGNLASPVNLVQMLRTKAVFLNWIEDRLDPGMKLRLLLYKALGAKIVWVFHNKLPHDAEDIKKMRKNMIWLADNSSAIILHSRCSRKYVPDGKRNGKKAVFVPHVLYKARCSRTYAENIRNGYGIKQDDFVFIIFGYIEPYKNIEGGIEAFKQLGQEHAKLLIAGSAHDSGYAEKIKRLCEGSENIILDLQFISNDRLGALILMSDVAVVPYKNNSSMNSGVMIQAFSQGKTVIAPDICMARDLRGEGFFYMYDNHDDLRHFMEKAYKNGKDANRLMGMKAKGYMMENNNEHMVSAALGGILNGNA